MSELADYYRSYEKSLTRSGGDQREIQRADFRSKELTSGSVIRSCEEMQNIERVSPYKYFSDKGEGVGGFLKATAYSYLSRGPDSYIERYPSGDATPSSPYWGSSPTALSDEQREKLTRVNYKTGY